LSPPGDVAARAGRVLVTGASGFIGRHALAPLLAANHEVHALGSARPAGIAAEGVQWHRLDLLDTAAAEQLVTRLRPELLLHLAWDVTPGRFWTAPGNVRWVEASLALMRAFVDAGGRRAVLAGTCAEYDWRALAGGGSVRCREGVTPLVPRTLYGACKHATHLVAAGLAAEHGVELAWGRIFHLYGPGEQPGRLVPAIAQALLRGESVPVSDGGQVRDFSDVRDVAAAFVALLDSEAQGAVNIASGEPVTVCEVIERIVAETGGGELVRWGEIERAAGEPETLLADVSRLRQEVGFRPTIGLVDGLRESVEFWRAAG
jgi:nucleoside-diphosphate-sugar epimerase